MSTAKAIDYSNDIAWEFFDDIPSLSNIAAMELNDMIYDRPFKVEGLRRLAGKIYDYILEESSLDRSVVVIMNMAIEDAKLYNKMETVEGVIRNTRELKERLDRIIDQPQEIKQNNPDELHTMRDFCRILFKRASALEPSIYEMEPWHPFRR